MAEVERNLKLGREVYVMLFIAINKPKRKRLVVIHAEALEPKKPKHPKGITAEQFNELVRRRDAQQKRLTRVFDNLPDIKEILHDSAIVENDLRNLVAQAKRDENVKKNKKWAQQYGGKVRKNIRINIKYLTLLREFAEKEHAYNSLIEYLNEKLVNAKKDLAKYKDLGKLK
jgi:hypothetical protein